MDYYLIKILIALSLSSSPQPIEIQVGEIMEVLKIVETNNNPKAISRDGRAYGILQIREGAVIDVNRRYGTKFKHRDMFNEKNSERVFYLYISMGIELYQKRNGRLPSEKDIVRFWNGGIYLGHKRKSTLKYYNKYLKVKKQLNVKKRD